MSTGSIRPLVMVFPGALGDFLLALPALRALRERHAGAPVRLVVGRALRSIATLARIADEVADLDAAEASRLFADGRPPSWLADRPVLHTWLGAGDGALRTRAGEWTAAATFHRVERGPGGRHAAEAYAEAVGLSATRTTLASTAGIDVPATSLADDAVTAVRGPVLVMQRGAGAPAKRWGGEGFAAVASWWRARGGAVIDVIGPAEHDLAPLRDATSVASWSLPDVAALLARADAYAGNDSGVSHLAGAVGARGVVVFTATAPERWRPISERLRVARPDVAEVVEALATS